MSDRGTLQEADVAVTEVDRKHDISAVIFYRGDSSKQGVSVPNMQGLREPEQENARESNVRGFESGPHDAEGDAHKNSDAVQRRQVAASTMRGRATAPTANLPRNDAASTRTPRGWVPDVVG